MDRLSSLDSLRGIAALTVVFYHYLFRFDEIYGHSFDVSWLEFGHFGVQLFFIVSGFVISWSLGRCEKPLDFIVSRAARLFPAYWVAVILTFSVVLLFGLAGRDVTLLVMFISLTMLQEFVGIAHVDGVYWTLTAELLFYFWIFLIYLSGNFKKVEFFFVPFLILSMLHNLGAVDLSPFVVKLMLLKHIGFFVTGICFYKLKNGEGDLSATGIVLLCAISTGFITFGLDYVVEIGTVFSLFYIAVNNRFKFFNSKVLVSLGGMSYSLYLIHQNIGYIVINFFKQMGGSTLYAIIGVATALCLSLVLAYAITKYIEKPINYRIKNTYRKLFKADTKRKERLLSDLEANKEEIRSKKLI